MLTNLSIRNIAVIDKLEVSFGEGLSVLTGETGAGKSIIIDSINMILGSRSSKELVRYGTDKAVVQAVFDANPKASALLEENDIDVEDNQIIISRYLTKDGKSVAKINGMAVTLNLLRTVADLLINIHGQHDNQALLTPDRHVTFLDAYAKNEDLLEEYSKIYTRMNEIRHSLKKFNIDETEKMHRIDLLEYQIKEISTANLTKGEEDELKEQRELLVNAEALSQSISVAYSALYDSENEPSAYDGISMAVDALGKVSHLNDTLKGIYDSLSEAMYSIEDSAHELKSFGDSVEYDPQTLNDIEERLDIISKLKRKYGGSIDEIIRFGENAQKELDDIVLGDERTEQLKTELDKTVAELKAAGAKITAARKKAAKALSEGIEAALHELNMDKASFNVSVMPKNEFAPNGMDDVEFLISTNPGEPEKPLVKIASGGELSRVMLAIKSIIASSDDVGTLIFDEIDTGVSGRAAVKITNKLKEIGKTKQVICISHLPQMASAADNHYLISKNVDGELASTSLTELDEQGRIEELARIIDGNNMTEAAVNHAKELLANNR